MDKKIEVSMEMKERIINYEKFLRRSGLPGTAGEFRERFREIFESEKHGAVKLMDSLIIQAASYGAVSVIDAKKLRSYFNDDGTLKDGQRGGV